MKTWPHITGTVFQTEAEFDRVTTCFVFRQKYGQLEQEGLATPLLGLPEPHHGAPHTAPVRQAAGGIDKI
jgi:hypothetical protein